MGISLTMPEGILGEGTSLRSAMGHAHKEQLLTEPPKVGDHSSSAPWIPGVHAIRPYGNISS